MSLGLVVAGIEQDPDPDGDKSYSGQEFSTRGDT